MMKTANDQLTAQGFAASWNNLPEGSVYTADQVKDWFDPVQLQTLKGRSVLELGCGNASLMTHLAVYEPKRLVGVDLGDSVITARKNLSKTGHKNYEIIQADLTEYRSEGFEFVYSIGVLHHLSNPLKGFHALIANTKSQGQFHAWVYGYEGNAVVRWLVEPIRKVASRLPWWFTKYLLATPLAVPVFCYAHFILFSKNFGNFNFLPLYEYCLWIVKREFSFFRHVVFDQLVARKTTYLRKTDIENWMFSHPKIDPQSVYIVQRNGNSWKFGGKLL